MKIAALNPPLGTANAIGVGFGEWLGALNQATKDFDMEAWKDQHSSCVLCHAPMSLDFGCEWPADPRLLLCWSCMSNALEKAIASTQARKHLTVPN